MVSKSKCVALLAVATLLLAMALTSANLAQANEIALPASLGQRMLRDVPSYSPAFDLVQQAADPPECINCMEGHPMPQCQCPIACDSKFSAFPCKGCMDGHGMPDCPNPHWCGYEGPSGQPPGGCPCVACEDGKSTHGCPHPEWCGYQPATQCQDCVPGEPTATCPCPAACRPGRSKPFQCRNCMDGHAMPGCPFPGRCGYAPIDEDDIAGCQCKDCMDGHGMPECPDPYICGFKPPCDGCMTGMPMPGCPYPDACPATCPMAMYFGTDYDVCLWFQDWHITDSQQYTGAIFFLIFVSFVREFFGAWRRLRSQRFQRSRSPKTTADYAIDTAYYSISLAVSYLLMLVFMTYNVGFCITIVVACGVAHFTFAWLIARKGGRI